MSTCVPARCALKRHRAVLLPVTHPCFKRPRLFARSEKPKGGTSPNGAHWLRLPLWSGYFPDHVDLPYFGKSPPIHFKKSPRSTSPGFQISKGSLIHFQEYCSWVEAALRSCRGPQRDDGPIGNSRATFQEETPRPQWTQLNCSSSLRTENRPKYAEVKDTPEPKGGSERAEERKATREEKERE